MWNIGSLKGNGEEIFGQMGKRMVDVCCLQLMRWRRQGSGMLGWRGDEICGCLEIRSESMMW